MFDNEIYFDHCSEDKLTGHKPILGCMFRGFMGLAFSWIYV